MTPSFNLLKDIYLEYENVSWKSQIDSIMTSNSLKFAWNWSTIDSESANLYSVSTPIVNDSNELLAMLMFYNDTDHSHYQIITYQDCIRATDNFTVTSVNEFVVHFMIKNLLLQRYVYRDVDVRMFKWLENYLIENDDKVSTRNRSFNLWYDLGYDYAEVSRKIKVQVPCTFFQHEHHNPGGGGGGGIVPSNDDTNNSPWWESGLPGGGGDDSNNESNNDNNDDGWGENEDCVHDYFTAELAAYVTNLEESTSFPCLDDTESLIDSLIVELCSHAGATTTIAGGTDGGDGSFGQEDFDDLWNQATQEEQAYNNFLNSLSIENDCNNYYQNSLQDIINQGPCNSAEFNQMFNDFFGITQTEPNQNSHPSFALGQTICGDAFIISDAEDDIHISAGISNLSFDVINTDDETLILTYPYINIVLNDDISQTMCPGETHQSLIAEAVNISMQEVRADMNNYVNQSELDPNIETFIARLNANLSMVSSNCSGQNASANAHLTNDFTVYSNCYNTVFTEMNQNLIDDCNN